MVSHCIIYVTRYISFKTPNKSVWHDIGQKGKCYQLKTNTKNVQYF